MLKILEGMSPKAMETAEYIILDRGYDGVGFQNKIKEKGIQPMVDNRIMRKGDLTIQYRDTKI